MDKDKRPLLVLLIPLILFLLGLSSYTAPGKITFTQTPMNNIPTYPLNNEPENMPVFILPELPLGPITALISMITAMVLLSKRPIIQK
jgi:hypothetical protein